MSPLSATAPGEQAQGGQVEVVVVEVVVEVAPPRAPLRVVEPRRRPRPRLLA